MTTCTVYRTWIKRGQLNWVTKLPYIRGVQLVYGQNIREQQTDGLFKSNANISIKNILRVVSGQAYYFSRTSGVKSIGKGPIRIKQCPHKISTFLKMNK